MADLDALYQELILEHNRKPRNFHAMEHATREVSGRNPLCGDELTLWVRLDGDRVEDISFVTPPGKGCAISKASASLMTAAVKGKTRAESLALFDKFHALVTGHLTDESERKSLGGLQALGGVAKFPIRVKCASLAWHALKSALEGAGTDAPVSTE